MYRDFSENSKQNLLGFVSEVENEKICDFTDWVGDRWYDFESWIGMLNIRHYLNDVNKYHKKVIDKNNATKSTIEEIFSKVKQVDNEYNNKLSNVDLLLHRWEQYIEQLNQIVTPQNGNFRSEYMKLRLDSMLNDINTAYKNVERDELTELLKIMREIEDLKKNVATLVSLDSGNIYTKDKSSEIMELLETLVGATGLSDSENVEVLGELASLFLDGIKAGNPEHNVTALDRMLNITNIESTWAKVLEKIFKLAKMKSEASAMGVIGSAMGIESELTKVPGRSLEEQLKNSGGLISLGASLAKNIYSLTDSGKEMEKFTNGFIPSQKKRYLQIEANKFAALQAMFSMGTYATGDIIEKAKDGIYDIQDYGNTLLATGITGMSSLVSSYTRGVVKIDTDRSLQVFDMSIKETQDIINSTGAPTPVKVVMAVPGTVIAASIGTVGTFIDYGMQIGENINKIMWGN